MKNQARSELKSCLRQAFMYEYLEFDFLTQKLFKLLAM